MHCSGKGREDLEDGTDEEPVPEQRRVVARAAASRVRDNAVRDLPTGSVKAVARAFVLACGSGRKASEALRGWREVLEARHGAAAVSNAYVDTRRRAV